MTRVSSPIIIASEILGRISGSRIVPNIQIVAAFVPDYCGTSCPTKGLDDTLVITYNYTSEISRDTE